MSTHEVALEHETTRHYEPMTDEQLGGMLAAFGNHEGKAITFLAMEDKVAYGVSAIHRRFLEVQGDRTAFEGTTNLQQKYFIYSFEPIGLVAKVYLEDGHLKHEKVDPDRRAEALAAHVLDISSRYPYALLSVFGKTQKSENFSTTDERTPIRRLALLEALINVPNAATQSDVLRILNMPEKSLSASFRSLREAGVLAGESQPTFSMKSAYRATVPLVVREHEGRGRKPVFHNTIVEYVNQKLAASEADSVEVTRDELEEYLIQQPQWQGKYIRDILQVKMREIIEDGELDIVQDYSGPHHTSVEMDATQLEYVFELVDGIRRIQAGDANFVQQCLTRGKEIMSNFETLRGLIRKAYGEANKGANNPVSKAEKQARVLAALRTMDGATTAELEAVLSPNIKRTGISASLSQLALTQTVEGVKQPDGPYKRWYLVPETTLID